MLWVFIFVFVTGFVVPVVINKSTDGGHFLWIKPWLRPIWTAILVFYAIYAMQTPEGRGVLVKLHARWDGPLGYLFAGVSGVILCCGFWWMSGKWFTNHLNLVFGSPFTEASKRMITAEFDGAQDYLKSVGFEVPVPIPPIQASNQVPGDSTAFVSNPGTLYGDSIFLYGKSIDNRETIRAAYFRWTFHRLLGVGKFDLLEHQNRWESVGVIASYYGGSYSNKKSFDVRREWNDALWDMRAAFTAKSMDTIMFYAVQNFQENGDAKKSFDIYFWNRVGAAMSVLDNSLKPKANEILSKNKIKWMDLPDSSPGALKAVP
jgi:hypothetical protein